MPVINRTTDPVLKKRVIFATDSHPLQKWAIGGGIILTCLGLIAVTLHFHPQIMDWLNRFNSPSPSQPTILTPQETSTPVANVPENVTAEISQPTNTTEDETLSFASHPAATFSTAQKPPLLNSTSQQPAPIEKATSQVSAQSMSQEMPPANYGNLKEINRLLEKSATQIRRTRFTSPKGDNAYETYQALRKIASQEAEILLDKIVAWYYERGQKYVEENKLTQPKSGNALQMYQKIHQLAPQHPNTQALFNNMLTTLTQQAAEYIEQKNWLNDTDESAYTVYQQLNLIAPQQEKTQQLFNTIVGSLSQQAQQQIAEQKYTTPNNDNAVETYKKILKIAPNHVEATEGLEKIIQKYYRLALLRKSQGRYKGSMIWIKRGLQVNPNHQELNELKQAVQKKL